MNYAHTQTCTQRYTVHSVLLCIVPSKYLCVRVCGLCVYVSVGGVLSLGVYTVLFLKLYSYQDTNRWCREIRQAKAKRMTRSYSCRYTHTEKMLNHLNKYKHLVIL